MSLLHLENILDPLNNLLIFNHMFVTLAQQPYHLLIGAISFFHRNYLHLTFLLIAQVDSFTKPTHYSEVAKSLI